MGWCAVSSVVLVFFFNDTATTEIYPLSLHDALPICYQRAHLPPTPLLTDQDVCGFDYRSEERFSRNAETDIVCRLLLDKHSSNPLYASLWTRRTESRCLRSIWVWQSFSESVSGFFK